MAQAGTVGNETNAIALCHGLYWFREASSTINAMTSRCGQCDATADGSATWGLGPPALGVMALIPSAILVSLLALLLPLSVTTVIAAGLLAVVQLALAWVLTTRAWPPQPAIFGLKSPSVSWRRALVFSGFALVASLGGAQLYLMAVTALGLDYLVPPDLPKGLLLPGGLVILTVIALAVVTPVAEEVFFRGFLLRGLVNRWGAAPGIIVSAAVFAGLHFQPPVIVPVFITGLILGALYWQTGSLWPGIFVHAAQNLIATLGIILGL